MTIIGNQAIKISNIYHIDDLNQDKIAPSIGGVYYIKNERNGKIYIGSRTDFFQRWILHKSQLSMNNHHNQGLQDDWNLFGEEMICCKELEAQSKWSDDD